MFGRQGFSLPASSATAMTATTVAGAAQVPRGAVTPWPDPEDVYRRKSAVKGPEPNVVGRSLDGSQLPEKLNAFLDPSSDRQVWLR